MARFGDSSNRRLDECHPDLQVIFREVVKSFDCSAICGHRGKFAQITAYESGKSHVTWPDSKHNLKPAMAVDAPPYPVDWNDTERFALFAGYVMATANQLFLQGKISHRIRWGGDWDRDTHVGDERFRDLAHFELIKAERNDY